MRIMLAVALACLPVAACAGTEYAVSYNGSDGHNNPAFQFEGGASYGPGWFSLGVRQNGGLFGSAGLRHEIIGVEGRIGYLYAGHESDYQFSSPYPDDTSQSFGHGVMAELSLTSVGMFEPFARYQVITVSHDYSAVRKVGTDANGNPVYGDPVSHSETNTVDEVVIGIRISY